MCQAADLYTLKKEKRSLSPLVSVAGVSGGTRSKNRATAGPHIITKAFSCIHFVINWYPQQHQY